MADTPTSSRLHVLKAVEDGWAAFTKAPWPFILFTLLWGALSTLFQLIGNLGSASANGSNLNAGGIILGIICLVGITIINLWGVIGLIRGAWIALNGERPSFSDFTRWDAAAAGRLFLRQIVLIILILLIVLAALVVGFGLGQINQMLWLIPSLIAFVIFVYLSVNQKFLPFVALFESPDPLQTIQRGRDVVDPSWWWVVLLIIVESLILAIGALLCGIGLLVAGPVVGCIATAAYRQLFGSEDQTGLISGN
ncbi:MAG: hypothetical protein AB8E87_02700 [Prochlorococcus sp.]